MAASKTGSISGGAAWVAGSKALRRKELDGWMGQV